jgi:hypothetical protein
MSSAGFAKIFTHQIIEPRYPVSKVKKLTATGECDNDFGNKVFRISDTLLDVLSSNIVIMHIFFTHSWKNNYAFRGVVCSECILVQRKQLRLFS